jgi:hypothetical protein
MTIERPSLPSRTAAAPRIRGRLHLVGRPITDCVVRLVMVQPGPRIRQVAVECTGGFELDCAADDEDTTVEVWVDDRLAGRCGMPALFQRLGRDRGVLAVVA